MKDEQVMKAASIESIPTECRRCNRIFEDKDLVWIQTDRNEKWFVCDHCADIIGYCNRMIDLIRECRKGYEETPLKRALRLSRENSSYGSFGRPKE